MCDSYETGEISVIQWVAGKKNISDVLTKRNVVMYKKLNEVMKSACLGADVLDGAKRTKFGMENRKLRFDV